MEYKELQKRATELGLKAVSVSAKELETSIKEAEAKIADGANEQPINPSTDNQNIVGENPGGVDSTPPAPTQEVPPAPKPEPKIKEAKVVANTAVVYKGSHEIRRYTLDLHGEDFAKLAEQFATARKYTVELIREEATQNCRNCNAKLMCQNCGVEVK